MLKIPITFANLYNKHFIIKYFITVNLLKLCQEFLLE